MKRLSILLAGLVAMARCWLWAAPGQPVELVPTSVLAWDADFKRATASANDKDVWFHFWVTNVCATNVLVLDVDTSCGCAVARLPSLPWVLAPGNSGPIRVNLDLRLRASPVVKGVEVRTSAGLKALVVRAEWTGTNTVGTTVSASTTEADRACNLQAALRDRQALFRGHCAQCHAQPAAGRRGRELYTTVCAICHESVRRSPLVPDLRTRRLPATLTAWRRLMASGVEGSVMPGFALKIGGPLTEDQIDSLAIYFLQDQPFRAGPSAREPSSPPRNPGAKPTPMSPGR
jgi:mono/diheme cytochrome c family protein